MKNEKQQPNRRHKSLERITALNGADYHICHQYGYSTIPNYTVDNLFDTQNLINPKSVELEQAAEAHILDRYLKYEYSQVSESAFMEGAVFGSNFEKNKFIQAIKNRIEELEKLNEKYENNVDELNEANYILILLQS